MADEVLLNDLFFPCHKIRSESQVMPARCYLCKRELDGLSITAKVVGGKTVFLCPEHLKSNLRQLVLVK